MFYNVATVEIQNGYFLHVCVVGVELVSCDLLREGAPIEPVPPVTHWKPEAVVSAKSYLASLKALSVSPHVWLALCVEFLLMTQVITEQTAKANETHNETISNLFNKHQMFLFSAGHPKAWYLKCLLENVEFGLVVSGLWSPSSPHVDGCETLVLVSAVPWGRRADRGSVPPLHPPSWPQAEGGQLRDYRLSC